MPVILVLGGWSRIESHPSEFQISLGYIRSCLSVSHLHMSIIHAIETDMHLLSKDSYLKPLLGGELGGARVSFLSRPWCKEPQLLLSLFH